MHYWSQPSKAETLKGLTLISQGGGRHAGKGGVVASTTHSIAGISSLTKDALPEIARGGRGLVPKRLEVLECGGDVRPAGAAQLGGLVD